MNEKRMQAATAASFSRMGSRILNGIKIVVKWIMDQDQLGFTADGKPVVVNVAWCNEEYMGSMSEDQKSFFRLGVFAHEVLHQVFTNFGYTHTICNKLKMSEAAVFMKFANTLEDPAIEYFAPQVMGGKMLKALKYMIASVYAKSPLISESTNAFSQMLNALIQFGDCGIVKGEFTFPEAEECFKKVAPIYNKGITCKSSRKRLDIALECMEVSRPLWEEYIKEQEELEKLMDELAKMLSDHGMSIPQMDEDDLDEQEGDEKSGIRSSILSKMSSGSEKSEEKGTGSSKADAEEDDGEAEEGEESGKGASDSNEKDAEESEGSVAGGGTSKSGEDKTADTSKKRQAKDKSAGTTPGTGDDEDEEKAAEIINEDLTLDDDDIESLRQDVEAADEEIQKKEGETALADTEEVLANFDIESSAFSGVSCKNRRIRNGSSILVEEYNSMIQNYRWEINVLTKALSKIFKADKEQIIHSTSGTYNINRGTIGCTARIMDKRRDPANKKDAAICLCVDLSGSMMTSGKIDQAKKMSMVFAEALKANGIPYYIMGFHADMEGYDVMHDHFVTWNGKGRETLAAMYATSNNFDGYSIRYAANLLKNRPENTKVLFVISDGLPACHAYRGGRGYSDTKQAVKEAKKICEVQGIGLGVDCSPEVLSEFYGKDFIYCKDQNLLTNTLSKKILKIFRR